MFAYAMTRTSSTGACSETPASSCCACTASANADEMTLIPDAAFVASVFVACLLGRITLSALLTLIVLVRLPLRSLTAFPLQSPLS